LPLLCYDENQHRERISTPAIKRNAGLKGKSGPPGNMNAFKHGLAAIQKRREESIITEHEENVRQQILDGLIADKGGNQRRRPGFWQTLLYWT